jgi:hypothetical protein
MKGRVRVFFSEEKNQKTFTSALVASYRELAGKLSLVER